MAAGYAQSRPGVHPWVVRRALARCEATTFGTVLDVGCGSGVSTRALEGVTDFRVGMEPAVAMLEFAGAVAPGAHFLAGIAEAIPLRDESVDLITAAGSLNYTDVERFFGEAGRLLRPDGVVVVYDFSPGRSFRESKALDEWFERFMKRYPAPVSAGRVLSPETLSGMFAGLRVMGSEWFEMGLTLSPTFYVDYMLTETNVAAAVRDGTALGEIRGWCEETLAPVWAGENREVLFRGYWFTAGRLRDSTR